MEAEIRPLRYLAQLASQSNTPSQGVAPRVPFDIFRKVFDYNRKDDAVVVDERKTFAATVEKMRSADKAKSNALLFKKYGASEHCRWLLRDFDLQMLAELVEETKFPDKGLIPAIIRGGNIDGDVRKTGLWQELDCGSPKKKPKFDFPQRELRKNKPNLADDVIEAAWAKFKPKIDAQRVQEVAEEDARKKHVTYAFAVMQDREGEIKPRVVVDETTRNAMSEKFEKLSLNGNEFYIELRWSLAHWFVTLRLRLKKVFTECRFDAVKGRRQ
jgi:hypothetical protein